MQETQETWVWSWVRKIPWRRAWQPTPVFLPGESHRRGTCWATVHMVAESWTQLKRLSMHTLWSHSEHCISKYWTTAPRRNTGLGSYESLVTTFSSTDWYTVFFICVLLTGTSLHRYCWLVNIELMASSTVTHTWIKLIYHVYWYFLSKECHSIFCI